MHVDDVSGTIGDAVAVSTVTTNLLGPIRMTSALVEHLEKQKASAIIGWGQRRPCEVGVWPCVLRLENAIRSLSLNRVRWLLLAARQ